MKEARANKRVYLIDDDRIVCHSLCLILNKYGYEVDVYHSAEAYLEKYNESDTGLLVLDQNMPGMTGLELQQELKEKNSKLKIIFITAVHDAIVDVAISNGAIKVFEKPFDPKKLVDILDQHLSLH